MNANFNMKDNVKISDEILSYNAYIDEHNIQGYHIKMDNDLNLKGYIDYLQIRFNRELELIKAELHCYVLLKDNKLHDPKFLAKIKDSLERLQRINTRYYNYVYDIYMHEGVKSLQTKNNFKSLRIAFLLNILALMSKLHKSDYIENDYIMCSLGLLDECNQRLYNSCVSNINKAGLQGKIIDILHQQKIKVYIKNIMPL